MEVVYPKYSLIEFIEITESGFKEHIAHLYVGFGTTGAVLHGTIGITIDAIKSNAAKTVEYITFVLNCMF
ncbi:hypothetical protein HOA55_00155 [archaeon]|jgi:hypothetical protein|nr:hypothetical protein [archaeon]MBT3577884.1 hypothetical protein [archaeon]MBT6819752.1 hypothetical protein [archaeon]MBT6955960.1 hypothetical protein [archaeon]MBT7025535.1 hypothetical protein [archaeon]